MPAPVVGTDTMTIIAVVAGVAVPILLANIGGFRWIISRQDKMHEQNGRALRDLFDQLERRIGQLEGRFMDWGRRHS